MFYWHETLFQTSNSLGHDVTRVEFVGPAEIHEDRRRINTGNTDWEDYVSAWSVLPFVAVIINDRHDRLPEVRAEQARALPTGGDPCDVPEWAAPASGGRPPDDVGR